MEGLCRASSAISIADSRTSFNEKWPKNRGFWTVATGVEPGRGT